MATEIERKFLVTGNAWRSAATGESIRQGYVWAEDARSLRVRIAGKRAFLTLKSVRSGCSRQEYEYEIPPADAQEMLTSLCKGSPIEKTRYTLSQGGREWIIDEFAGENAGLIVAEIELDREDEEVDLPDWAGREVTSEPRYFNVNLIDHPFRLWTADERAACERSAAGGHDIA